MAKNSGGKICVSVAAATTAEALAIAQDNQELADVIEIRLDGLQDPDIPVLLRGLQKPLLFTNRPDWEGGRFKGEERARTRLLLEAIGAGAAYVDVELGTDPGLQQEILEAARAGKTQVIVSWHDFKTTPSAQALATIFQRQYRSGAQIGKIVTMARGFRDVLQVLALQAEAAEMEFPLIAFCMGRPGMISRLATLELNGFMTYAAPDQGLATAPGQFSLAALRVMLEPFTDAH